ncbi:MULTISPECIES: hypothetical protein [unclassified Peribacillus]|nr:MULTISPECIES: hypothetical protein [unclassified Peribacillus]WMX54750.1 hypothetical protein RE409_22220 [Peribacillus sp. R9-11]
MELGLTVTDMKFNSFSLNLEVISKQILRKTKGFAAGARYPSRI